MSLPEKSSFEAGAALMAAHLHRARRWPEWPAAAGLFLLGFGFVFPFVFFVVARPVAYDCIRHFTFLLPLAAATSEPARAFGFHDRGRIAVGLCADLLLVNGDPSVDVTATRDVVGIWKLGAIHPRGRARQ